MTKVKSSELTDLQSDKTLTDLEAVGMALSKASSTFENFSTHSKRRLKGEGYDAIRLVTSICATMFSKLSTLDQNACDNINQGINKLVGFMGDYTKLDDSRKDHLGNGLMYIGTQIGIYEAKIKKAEGEELTKAKATARYYYDQYNEVLKEYNKLKELASVNASTGGFVENVNTDISKITTYVNQNWC